MELAHATRVATLGQLSASIAHELKQPLAAIVIGGDASLSWLTRQPPEIEKAELAWISTERESADIDLAMGFI